MPNGAFSGQASSAGKEPPKPLQFLQYTVAAVAATADTQPTPTVALPYSALPNEGTTYGIHSKVHWCLQGPMNLAVYAIRCSFLALNIALV